MAEVVIQPTGASGKDAYVSNANPNTNYGGSDVRAGTTNASVTYRGLVEIDVTDALGGASVDTAALHLYLYGSGATAANIGVHEITADWLKNTVTWNNQPAITATAEDTKAVAITLAKWHTWDVSALVRDWYKGARTNRGVMLKDTAEATGARNKEFYGAATGGAGLQPKLVIQTTARPVVTKEFPNGTQSEPVQVDDTCSPTLTGWYMPMTGLFMAYRQHRVYDELANLVWDSGKVAEVKTPTEDVRVTVPTGYLRYGRKYYWQWMAWDEMGGYSEWTSAAWFTCQLTEAPAATDLAGGKHLYAIHPTGRVVALEEGATNLGAAISWEEVFTVPITRQEDWAGPTFYLTRVRMRLKLPVGSTANVYYSVRLEDEGDGSDWLTAHALTAAAGIQIVDIAVPFASGEDYGSHHFRLKLSGTKAHELHAIVFEYEEAES